MTPSWLAWRLPASPSQTRRQAIVWGISGAVALRLVFAGLLSELSSIIGLTLAGGLLLLWVCWKMFRKLCGPAEIYPTISSGVKN